MLIMLEDFLQLHVPIVLPLAPFLQRQSKTEANYICVQPKSKFAAAYTKGINKKEFWDPVYEDSLNLIAKMPAIAALIYRRTYKSDKLIDPDPKLDWAANLAHQMGKLPHNILMWNSDSNPSFQNAWGCWNILMFSKQFGRVNLHKQE